MTKLSNSEGAESKTVNNELRVATKDVDYDYDLFGLAQQIDVSPGDVPWVVMADPEGNEFCVLRTRRP